MKRFYIVIALIVGVALGSFGALRAPSFFRREVCVSPLAEVRTKVENYPIYHVVERCKKDHGYSNEEMLLLERELKRYLVLVIDNRERLGRIGMYSKHVDNLWHSFILFTKQYRNFCLDCAGYFIHHDPEIDVGQQRTSEERMKRFDAYREFILLYEQTFGEPINPIWLLDSEEKRSDV